MAYLKWSKKVPSQLVAHRAASTYTPTSWSEVTTARGRCIVGVPSGGTDGATQGTALTDNQNKSKSIAHTHSGGAHTHTGPSHKHGITGLGQHTTTWYYNTAGAFGTSGTGGTDRKVGGSMNLPGPVSGPQQVSGAEGTGATSSSGTEATSAMSANATVETADVMAYIQMVTIKKN